MTSVQFETMSHRARDKASLHGPDDNFTTERSRFLPGVMTRPLSGSRGSDRAIPRPDPHGSSHHAIMQGPPSPNSQVSHYQNDPPKHETIGGKKFTAHSTSRLYCVIVCRLLAKGLSLRGCAQETSLAQFSPFACSSRARAQTRSGPPRRM